MKIEKLLVTPKMAEQYLANNPNNRHVNRKLLTQLTNDMLAGNWREETGELIKIAKDGRLLDGQHRLLAVVKSEKSICFHVAFDLNENIFDVLDSGAPRSAADAFHIAGIKHSALLPAIINTYYLLEKGVSIKNARDIKPTTHRLLEMYKENEHYWQELTNKTNNYYAAFARILAPSLIGGLFALFDKLSEDNAEPFISQLTTGANIKNSAILLLRQRLISDKTNPYKMTIENKIALIYKTWNYFVSNEKVKVLRFNILKDEYPQPIGKKQKLAAAV